MKLKSQIRNTFREFAWALSGPTHHLVLEAEKNRRRRDGVKTEFLITGQLALNYLCFIRTGALAGASLDFGGIDAILTNLARPTDFGLAH